MSRETREPIGYEQLDITSGAAVNLTATVYTKKGRLATRAEIVNKTAVIRVRVDGTAATTSIGTPVAADQKLALNSAQAIKDFSAIAESTSAKIHVHYFR